MAIEHPPFIDVFFHLNLHLVRRCTATLAAKRERRASHRIGVWFFIFFSTKVSSNRPSELHR
jgi:hypothetical protein